MKKILCFMLISLSSINIALAENTVFYAPFTVPANSEISFDLTNSSPQSPTSNVLYKMICTTSAEGNAELLFKSDADDVDWFDLKVTGIPGYTPTQFELPANVLCNLITS